ncbi:YhgE/Pip domain-containing protein [Clostridium bowmanii]|uniref:YhgE/Pip domain-containing protein n=1 Tax=Clostridium bowmanii TaxID=132925 RepID=UPI001C0D2025|nr:YhgE/Pip domain-containing protein [Clostridium bowmanii]MBU3190099.1 YhgE/Pip domain-containing protein [Clostridium bowmanii]MCA1074694.1 YhgE/Pip domain-containing protein [Clostridium bowmanii]
MNFLKVAGRDISSIFKNRFIRVSVIAIIIVPLLYSLLYLDAFWDPYARIKDMPVAVVNQDKGSIKDGEKVNYGENLVNNLKEKEAVGWRFVTKKQAEAGVKGKDYYAMFIIPEDFSENALSVTKGKTEQAKILYSANEKRNFLAAQINGKVLDQLKSELTKNMSKEYTTVVFDSMYEIKDGMKKASEGSKELAEGLITAKDGTSKLKDGTGQLNSSVPEMMDGVEKLLAGSNTLTSKLGELNSKVPIMVGGVNRLYGGADKLNNGLTQLNNQVPTMAAGVEKLNEAYKTQIVPSTGKLKDGANQLAIGLGAAKEGATQLSEAATKLNDGSALLTDGSVKLNAGYAQMKPGITSLKDGSEKVAGGVDVLIDNSKKSQASLKQGVDDQLGAYLKAHPEAMKDPNMQGFLATLGALNKISGDEKNLAMMIELQTGAHKVAIGANQLEEGSSAFVDGSQKFAQSTVIFASVSEQFSKGAGSFGEKTGTAVVAATQISSGLDQLYAAMNGEFGSGLSQLSESVPALTAGVSKLTGGSVALESGLSGLNNKMPTLADGTSKLNVGSAKLTGGISTLNGKLPKLKDGVNKLYDGVNKLDDGAIKLADGSKELNEKLEAGYKDLSSSLKNDSKTMAATFAEPVVMDQQAINPVKTYGEGFTPYFIPLSLWVGALMMFFVITDKVDEDIEASPSAVVAGKFLSYGAIGFMQAVLASGAVMLLGLRPNNILLYFLFNIFLSCVFIAIIQCMVFLLGQVGRLISIILLILQLTSCAGTFPIEVVPKLFVVLNPFMPFTYAVSGLREVVSGVDYAVFTKDVIVLTAMLFVFLFTSIIMKGHADKVQKLVQDRKEQAANMPA